MRAEDARDWEHRLVEERRLRHYTERVLDQRQGELEAEEAQVVRQSHTIRRLEAELNEAR